jgi:hypothetical protein
MAVLQAKATKIVNAGCLNDVGTISILVAAGDTMIDLELSPKHAQFVADGLKGAVKKAAKKSRSTVKKKKS